MPAMRRLSRTVRPGGARRSPARPPLGHALACFAAACLAGCTLGPDYKRPELPLPTTWRAELPNAGELANTDWWHAFGDVELDRLIDAAIDANLDLKLAAHRVEAYNARLQIAQAPYYPQIGYLAATGRERRSQERPNGLKPGEGPAFNNYEIGATFSWEIDLWGRVRRADEAATANLLATQHGRRAVMLSVVAGVASGYLQLLELDRQLEIAKLSLKNREEALTLIDAKYRGGSAALLAVEQARAAVQSEEAAIPPIEREIATQENALSGLLGGNSGPIQRSKLDLLILPQLPQGVPADILSRRPDVMAAEQALVAANARIGIAKAEYFPTISLTSLLGVGADDVRYLFAETARTGNVTASILGPVFSGFRIEGDIRQAEALQREATVAYQQSVLNALREVEDALVARTKLGTREVVVARRVGTLEGVSGLARQRYEGGQSTFFAVLDADLQLLSARSGLASSRRDTLLALVSVYKAMGGGWMIEQEKRRSEQATESIAQAQNATDENAPK